jgi:hypothetical protein
MKKKIINGILLVALVFATSSAFVSCKDNDSDVKTELMDKIAQLKEDLGKISQQVGPQGPEGPKGKDGEPGKDGATPEEVIAKLQDQLAEIEANAKSGASKAATEAALAKIEEEIGKINAALKDVISTVIVEGTFNPVFGSISIPGFNPLVLAGYYAETKEDIAFPADKINIKGVDQLLVDAGEQLVSAEAGKVYVTLNPNNVSTEGKKLALQSSAGRISDITLGALAPSDDELNFGFKTRGAAGFYEATAIMPEDISNVKLNIDFQTLKSEAKEAAQKRTKKAIARFVADAVYEAQEVAPAYAVNVKYDNDILGKFSINSGYQIMATAIKPLSFDFEIPGRFAKKIPGLSRVENAIDDLLAELNVDISADAKIIIKKYDKNDPVTLIDVDVIIPASTATASDGTTVNIDARTVTATVPVADALNDLIDGLNGDLAEVNDLLDQIQKFSNLGTKLSDKIGGYFDRANNIYAKLVNAFNTKALEPTLLMIDNGQYKRVRRGVDAGKIELVPTTWTSELLAPAYAKFVAVVAIDGKPATAADNEGNLGEILYGNEKVYLNVEAGKTYKIAYSAVDFFGVTRTHYYTIKGK